MFFGLTAAPLTAAVKAAIAPPPPSPTAAPLSGEIWFKYGERELAAVLGQSAFVAEGAGTPLYVLASPQERATQLLWLDRKPFLDGFEFRWLPFCQESDDPDQTVELLIQRDQLALRYYMAGLLPAAPAAGEARRLTIFNAQLAVVRFILKVFSFNGAERPGGAPRFIWFVGTDAYGLCGYEGPETLERLRSQRGVHPKPPV
jgi:hypothetical protein